MIEKPPTSQVLQMDNDIDETIKDVISNINNNYYYWSEIKYRTPAGINPKELWNLVKSVRKQTEVPVWDFDNIHFSLTNSMQRECHIFDMNFGGSWGASKIFPDDKTTQELYLISSIMEEAIASSQMEGASTTREAAKEMLRKKISPRDKSQQMILNNYNTINFIRNHAQEDLTPELVMTIHGMMTDNALDIKDAAGRFRKDEENIVVGDGITGETVHTPPPASCLPSFIENLCKYFNDRNPKIFIHPIIRGIIIHFLIGYYHPFADGNGRTARALFYWYMMRSNYWLVQYLSISRIIRGSKKAYEKAYLYSESDNNDIGYFIKYNLDVLYKSFDALSKYIKRKHNEKKKAEKLMHLGDVSERESNVLSLYIENPDLILVSTDLIPRFGISANTAKSDLKDLTQKGYLKDININGRTKGYIRSEEFFDKIGKIKN